MSKELNQKIGARIRRQRELLGLTREELCNFVAISPQFLSEIERGVKGVSAEMLYNLCKGLGASADYVLMGKEKEPDVSEITALLMTVDERYLPLVEDVLKGLFKIISTK